MKKFILLLLTFASAKAFALEPRDGYYVCNRINDGNLKAQCISVVSSSYVDQYAAAACDRINSSTDTVACMRAIANRSYDRRAVEACDSITTTPETLSCLTNSGYAQYPQNPQPQPPSSDLRNWVRESARYGRDQLDRGNIQEVRRLLEQMMHL